MVILLCETGRDGRQGVRKAEPTGRMDSGHAQLFDIAEDIEDRRQVKDTKGDRRQETEDRRQKAEGGRVWSTSQGSAFSLWATARQAEVEAGIQANPNLIQRLKQVGGGDVWAARQHRPTKGVGPGKSTTSKSNLWVTGLGGVYVANAMEGKHRLEACATLGSGLAESR